MRKVFLLMSVFALFAVGATAQTPYASATANTSKNTMSYSAEVGVSYPKLYSGVNYTYTPVGKYNFLSVTLGYKLVEQKQLSVWSDNSVGASLDKGHELTVSPGVALYYALTKNISPQFKLAVPITEGGNASVSCSAGIFYTF